jgi:hypothetical protein
MQLKLLVQMNLAGRLAFLVMLGLVSHPAQGQAAGPASAEDGPTAFTCAFKAGTTLTYNKAKSSFRKVAAKPLNFDVSAIDLAGQKAELTSKSGKGPLRIVRALNANHYLEVVGEGFLNITTIYDRDAKTGGHPAVHSRHFGLFGEPVVAQYQGFCKGK